jgi:hypothetical protein
MFNVATSLSRFLASGSFMISFRPSIPNWFFGPKSSLPVHAGASSQTAAQLKTTFQISSFQIMIQFVDAALPRAPTRRSIGILNILDITFSDPGCPSLAYYNRKAG